MKQRGTDKMEKYKNLENKTKKELYQIARELKIKGRSKMRKNQLLEAIKSHLAKEEIIKENKPLEMSLEEDNFSSHIHPIEEDIKKEIEVIIPEEEPVLPDEYNIDRVVLLPVDPHKHFVYWELSEETFKTVKDKQAEIYLKLFEEGKEVLKQKIDLKSGKQYINYYAPYKKLYVELIIEVSETQKTLLKSTEIITPSDTISISEEEVFMFKDFKGSGEKKITIKRKPETDKPTIESLKELINKEIKIEKLYSSKDLHK